MRSVVPAADLSDKASFSLFRFFLPEATTTALYSYRTLYEVVRRYHQPPRRVRYVRIVRIVRPVAYDYHIRLLSPPTFAPGQSSHRMLRRYEWKAHRLVFARVGRLPCSRAGLSNFQAYS